MVKTAEEARDILQSKFPHMNILSAVDYSGHFILNAEPKNFNKERDKAFIGGLYSVKKSTGEINGFNPMTNNPAAYFNAAKNKIVRF